MGESDTKKFELRMILKYVSTIISWTIFALLSILSVLLVYYFISSRLYAAKGEKFEPAFSIFTIVSGSMEPTINVYDVIVNSKVGKNNKINVSDVITFTSTSSNTAGMTITHRVIGIRTLDDNSLCYVTRGDNNTNEDSNCVARKNVIGKVTAVIPQLGRIQFFLASKFGWLLIIVIPALYIIIKDILKIMKIAKSNKEEITEEEAIQKDLTYRYEPLIENYKEYVDENKNIEEEESIDDNYFENKEIILPREKKKKIEALDTPFMYYDVENDLESRAE